MVQPRLFAVVGLCLAGLFNIAAAPAPTTELERVVIVMRHGVRPPTKSAAALAPLSDQAWPDDAAWGVVPGELTPHGAAAIRLEAAAIRAAYAAEGLVPRQGPLTAQTLIWADGGDERTRDTAKAVAEGFDPAEPPPPHGFAAAGTVDPLFDGLADSACKLDPSQAARAVEGQAPLTTPAVDAGLARLQAIVAPTACTGGAGACLTGPSSASPGGREVKLAGPLATGATLAENLLLEYQDGLPMTQVGWGRMSPADLATVMPVHDRAADLTRATPYIGVRRAGAISRLILAVLNDQAPATAAPTVDPGRRLVVLVGHDTNLSNVAGAFGLRWSLPGQPDATAPGVALAFERWRDAAGGERVKVRVFYQTPDEVRSLSANVESVSVACGPSESACALAPFTARIEAAIPAGCGG